MSYTAFPDQSQLLKKIILAHEYGHGLQEKYDQYVDAYVAPEIFEKDADCLAGAALNELGAPYTDTAKNADIEHIYKTVARGDGAKDHGSGEERFDAFLTGQRPFMGQQSSCGVIPESQA